MVAPPTNMVAPPTNMVVMPLRFFDVIAPAGRLYAQKKMAGSVSLEHSTIKKVKMMYS
jgi:hypothetical protein